MVTEFLHRIKDVFADYFGSCSVQTIKDNFVVVYELLDELLDAGFPLVTEPNVLKELIRPTTILRSITNTVTGKGNVSENLPSGQLSNIPWRKASVKYTNNEAFFDIKENVFTSFIRIYFNFKQGWKFWLKFSFTKDFLFFVE